MGVVRGGYGAGADAEIKRDIDVDVNGWIVGYFPI